MNTQDPASIGNSSCESPEAPDVNEQLSLLRMELEATKMELARVGSEARRSRNTGAEHALSGAEESEERRQQVFALTRLHHLAIQSADADKPEALLESILRTAVDLHGASHGLISLLDTHAGTSQIAASVNFNAEALRQLTDFAAAGMVAYGSALAAGKHVILAEIETEPRCREFHATARRIGLRAAHDTPMLTRDARLLGVLSLFFPHPCQPTEMAIQITAMCARHAAATVENAENRRALRESEERFRNMADNAPMMVWVADEQHSCTFLSKSWRDFTGQNQALGLGAGWLQALHPDDREFAYSEFQNAVIALRPWRMECRFRRHDGQYRWCIDAAAPRFDSDGKFLGFIGSIMDITERKAQEEALKRSEQLYRAIGESIDYGIWICDPQGRNLYASESFLKLAGMTQEECSQFGWIAHLHPEEADATLAAWQECVRSGSHWSRTHRFRGSDGVYHPILVRGLPVRDEQGRIVFWAGINLDISREQQAEDALRDADRRKDDFLAVLAHELRNPLAPIRNALEMLKLQPRQTPIERRSCEIIDRQLHSLVRLVDDLLDVSRISRGKLDLRSETVTLGEIIDSAVETTTPSFEAAQHRLDVELPPHPVTLQGDRVRLAQMIGNLLNNSAKYTPRNGHIVLRASTTPTQLQISVQDNGMGIPQHSLRGIFTMFAQLDHGRRNSSGGLGIGLALVKALAEMHGGHVVAHSAGEGCGSTFIVTLPLATVDASDHSIPQHAAPVPAKSRRRVLIADDNADAAQSLAMLLDLLGHDTQVVEDGLQAVEAVKTFVPEFIFLDIGMPNLDGIEAARCIRALHLPRQPVIIALTGWGQQGDRDRSRAAGVDHHMVKPITLDAIQALVANDATIAKVMKIIKPDT